MIFQALTEAADRDELLLVDGGLCRYHRRRDGVLTILEIVVLPRKRRQGLGACMVAKVKQYSGAKVLRARCPEDLPSNAFWEALGFTLVKVEAGRKRKVNVWEHHASSIVRTATPPSPAPQSLPAGSTGLVSLPLFTSASTSPTRTGSNPTGGPT